MRHYYALSDSSTSPNPAEPASGFANSCEAIAFDSLSKRTAWLAATKLLKACAITLPEAIKLTPTLEAPRLPKGPEARVGVGYRRDRACCIHRSRW